MRVDDEIQEWVKSFVKDKEEADGLINQLQYIAHKYGKQCFGVGILVGIVITFILIKWVS